jgi:TonB family protein
MQRVFVPLATAIALLASAAPGAAQTAPTPSSAPPGQCSSFIGGIVPLDDAGRRYALAFFTHDGTRRTSGTVALNAGDERYDASFAGATAVDPRDRDATPTPVVVRFAEPVKVDLAMVIAIDGTACNPRSEPWFPRRRVTPAIGYTSAGVYGSRRDPVFNNEPSDALWDRFRAQIPASREIEPGRVVHETHVACGRENVNATTAHAAQPDVTQENISQFASGRAAILVTLDAGSNVVRTRVEESSRNGALDRIARAAAERTEFRSPVIRCRPYAGSYLYEVRFGAG